MPVERTYTKFTGSFRALPRRFQALFALLGLFATTLLLYGLPSKESVTTVEGFKEAVSHPQLPKVPKVPSIPNKYNPFGIATHKPAIQPNSTSGESSWFSDWSWHNPFSSSITLDENRAVLPPLRTRHKVYTFYDDDNKNAAVRDALNDQLLRWRRAWWAQGFQPIVLSRGEAMENPMYGAVKAMQLKKQLESELTRWMAWAQMETGIMANQLAFPMAAYDHPELVFFRRGEYPPNQIISHKNGVFAGEQASVKKALETALKSAKLKDAESVVDLLTAEDVKIEKSLTSIAYYDSTTQQKLYTSVASNIKEDTALGFKQLGLLINAHLHGTWQNTFSDGIAVLQPLEHTTALVEPAVDIARNLSQCATNPLPTSCPPNIPSCRPCVHSLPRPLKIVQQYRNNSKMYTIGAVPHPYTSTSLHYRLETITPRFLRREEASRDMWINTVFKDLMKTASAAARVLRFKEAVAGYHGAHHSLWLTAEKESHTDLDWIFGFHVPRESAESPGSVKIKIDTAGVALEKRPPPPTNKNAPKAPELLEEQELLAKARRAIKSKVIEMVKIRDTVEAWSLADTEAWRFARAFSARRRVEKEKWEQEEKKYAGAENRKNGWGLNRWLDRE